MMNATFLPTMFGLSGLAGLVFAIIAVLVLMMLNKFKGLWLLFSNILPWAFCAVWLLGFAVYDVGMYTGHPLSLLSNIPMSVLYAFGMFVLNSDVSAVHESLFNSSAYMACFSLVHFLAACVSLVFVIKHFGFSIISSIRMFFAAHLHASKEHTYVFWGMNDATWHLARSIYHHHHNDDSFRIIVIRTNNDSGDKDDEQGGMERFFNLMSVKGNDLDRLQELDCLTPTTYTDLADINLPKDTGRSPADILHKELGLHTLCRIILRKTSGDVHFFFLGSNKDVNIQAVANLKRDATIGRFVEQGHKAILYCRARYNSISRVVEDEQPSDHLEVKIVDASRMSINLLKQDVTLQPVSFVDIGKDATVSSPFHALVVGFGDVGLDSVRFLYEYGAFVKKGSTDKDVQRSDFSCNVVDSRMSLLAGTFVANDPAVKPSMPFLQGGADDTALITLHQMDCHSVDFYQRMEEWIKTLNYIVICTGDDDRNISLAVRLFKMAIRYRHDMEHFAILVRTYHDDDGHISRIAHHYNRLWAAEMHSTDAKKRTHQTTIAADACLTKPIVLFGKEQELYTYDNVISEQLQEQAKLFQNYYETAMNALRGSNDSAGNITQYWENDFRDLMQLTDDYKGYAPTYSAVRRLRRIQIQNMTNSQHRLTKQLMAQRALSEADYALLSQHVLRRKENEIVYTWKKNVKPQPAVIRVLNVLAQTEHLRWNASHIMLGYCPVGDENHKDEARMQHGCIMEWRDLSEVVQSYDYNVVDVSLGVID